MISDSSVASMIRGRLGVSQRCSSQAFSPCCTPIAGAPTSSAGYPGGRSTGLSMLLAAAAHRFPSEKAGYSAYGIAQFLAIVGGLGFVLAADAYRARPRIVRGYALVLLPLLLWFGLAPLVLKSAAAFGPGHLLIAGALAAAGIGHLSILRQGRLLGALVVGATFIAIAGTHLWVLIGANASQEVSRLTFIDVALNLVAALGMQLMAFEDMTYELRMTNTHLAAAQDELRQLVTTDTLTGCRNRRYFDEVIGREVQRHRRYNIPLSVVFIDVDRFKTINDTLGHEEGIGSCSGSRRSSFETCAKWTTCSAGVETNF